MKNIGVILSGCGVFDGAEIHESVIALLALDRAGAKASCFAPDVDQMHVIDHLAGAPTAETPGAPRAPEGPGPAHAAPIGSPVDVWV